MSCVPGQSGRAFLKPKSMRYTIIVLLLFTLACNSTENQAEALPGRYTIDVELPTVPDGPGKDAILAAEYGMTIYENGTAGFTADLGSEMINTQLWEWSISGDTIAFDKPNGQTDRYRVEKTPEGWRLAKTDQIFNLKRQ